MNASQKLLLTLLERALFSKCGQLDFQKADWREVYREASAQSVAALALEGASALIHAIDAPTMAQWKQEMLQTFAIFERQAMDQDQLCEDIAEFSFAILKGMSVARYYPKPELRMMGDIDFLVDTGCFSAVIERLTNEGYKNIPETRYKNPCVFVRNHGRYEQHRYMNGLPSNQTGDRLTAFVQSGLSERRIADIGGHRFPVLPAAQQGLTLLLHMAEHIQCSGMGLRQFCDWALFIHYETPERLPERLEEMLKKSGLYYFAQLMTKTAKIYLGLPQDEALWADEADPKGCEALIQDLLRSGNMGMKDREFFRGRQLVAERHSGERFPRPVRIAHNLQWIGLRQWKALKKYPCLKAIAWCYWPIQYAKKIFRGERSLRALPTMYMGMMKSTDFLDKLQLYKTEKEKKD